MTLTRVPCPKEPKRLDSLPASTAFVKKGFLSDENGVPSSLTSIALYAVWLSSVGAFGVASQYSGLLNFLLASFRCASCTFSND